ncbi:hypothetical protein TNCV_51371 [Trichonephila clavipes]|nr:hypothetical protein TNCV_51371 [Trichonephila clavipes]
MLPRTKSMKNRQHEITQMEFKMHQTLMRTWERGKALRHILDHARTSSSKNPFVKGLKEGCTMGCWRHDSFCQFDVNRTSAIGHTSKPINKRIVLQSAGKIYDPVGFLSPYTIRLKCLLQELWLPERCILGYD